MNDADGFGNDSDSDRCGWNSLDGKTGKYGDTWNGAIFCRDMSEDAGMV